MQEDNKDSSQENNHAHLLDKKNHQNRDNSRQTTTYTDSHTNTNTQEDKGKIKGVVKGANDLSLGISMIVAVLLGLGIGYGLYKWLGYYWLIWVGLGYGVAAAILNVVKAYKRLHKDLESLKNDEKYKYIQDRILEKREKELQELKKNKEH